MVQVLHLGHQLTRHGQDQKKTDLYKEQNSASHPEFCSIPVCVALERALDLNTNVVGLLFGEGGEVGTKSR